MNKVKTHFIIRMNKLKKDGTAPIYLRLDVDGKRVELSTGKSIEPDKWCKIKRRVKGNSPKVHALNTQLDQYERRALEAESQLLKTNIKVTAQSLKQEIKGEKKVIPGVLEYFRMYIQKMEKLVGIDNSLSTLKRYRVCYKHLEMYLDKENKMSISLDELNLAFIQGFEVYLKTKNNPCSHNSALKYIDHFRRVVYDAFEKDLIRDNPFKQFKKKYKTTDPYIYQLIADGYVQTKKMMLIK